MFRPFILFILINLVKGSYEPIEKLSLDSYIGEWYQVYGNNFDKTFQGNGKCVRAFYKFNSENVSVVNTQLNQRDEEESITGFVFYKDDNTGGELTVELKDLPDAPYWVIELGPIVDNLYDYSIVSDNLKLSLFVLARNVSNFFKLYNEKVLDSLKEFGFNKKINMPILTDQSDC